ncbi:MAG: DUF1116 domain-containing protein, partial [Candidatus Eremiobacteraeota bacterium]|nr:DUF1116 domain-containing protein [Candidatus Eremiobacteraeota bacterium]
MSEIGNQIETANEFAIEMMRSARPVWVDVGRAIDVIPGMEEDLILHAGPPIAWEDMCGPMKGAVLGALVYEGKASDLKKAEALIKDGEIRFAPCHHHRAVGPMAGIISPSMYVFIVENKTHGNRAYCTINEGLGKVLRFGANSPDVIEHLLWMENTLGPVLKDAINHTEKGIDIKAITTQALQMGDECHNRNVAATNLLLKELMPYLLALDRDRETITGIVKFISGNPHFFLNLSMPACKAIVDTIRGKEYCTIMSAMARNGVKLGIQVASLGNQWFTADAGQPKGLYFPGFSEKDANPDLGDSTISETAGIGAFAMASAPAIVRFIGGSPKDAVKYTKQMYEICFGTHVDYQIPYMDFAGTPLGVDIRKVVEKQITPIINTGIAHREPGIG